MIQDKYRIWDSKHCRWFQGHPDAYHRQIQTDCIHFFGELMIVGEAFHDQNEDDIWKSDDDIKSSLDIFNYLQVIHCAQKRDNDGDWIFEGDVIIDKGCGQKYVVFWDDENLTWKAFNLLLENTAPLCRFQNTKIEGNIYSNPDYLLTVSDKSKALYLKTLPPIRLGVVKYKL